MPELRTAISINQRLVNASKKLGVSHELLLRRYVFERLLHRISLSPHAGDLCLKGAMSFLAVTGDVRRPTKDMDFLGRRSMPSDDTLSMFRAIAAMAPDVDDGLDFHVDGFSTEVIKGGSDQPGTRVNGIVRLGNARINLKVEIAYGDVLTPGAVGMEYPTLLDGFDAPRILVVSKETMLAEKFEAVCSLGERNTRFKDFHDIRGLSRLVALDGAIAAEAMRATFANRGTPLPVADPVAFTSDFADAGQRGWSAYLRKQGVRDGQKFADLVDEIRPLVMGLAARALGADRDGAWVPGEGWAAAPAEDDRTFMPF
jgi:predicted nucleotidyltransferase component of viral defense system